MTEAASASTPERNIRAYLAQRPWRDNAGIYNRLPDASALLAPGGTWRATFEPRVDAGDLDWRAPSDKPDHARAVLAIVRHRRPAGNKARYAMVAAACCASDEYGWGDGAGELETMTAEEAAAKGYEILRNTDEGEPQHDLEKGDAWGVRYEGWVYLGAGATEDGYTGVAPAPSWDWDMIAWAEVPAAIACPSDPNWMRPDGYAPSLLVPRTPWRLEDQRGSDEEPTHAVKFSDGTIHLARLRRVLMGAEGRDGADIDRLIAALFHPGAPDDAARLAEARRAVAEGSRDFYLFDEADGEMPEEECDRFAWIEIGPIGDVWAEALRARFRPDLPPDPELETAPDASGEKAEAIASDPDADPSDEFETALDLLENAANDRAERGDHHLRCKRIDEARAALRALAGF